ncbi:MAG: FtsX-like permease family protein [Vicinamibacterales bacterium]
MDVSTGYFDTLGLPLVRGRAPRGTAAERARTEVLVNDPFVARFLGHRDPVGTHLTLTSARAPDAAPIDAVVVGVAPLIRQRMPAVAQNTVPGPAPVVYVPVTASAPATLTLIARRRGQADIVPAMRAAVAALDASIPLYRVRTLRRAIDDTDWAARVSERLAITLTVLCLMMAGIGLYAVTAYRVSLRAEELGVRRALGAGGTHLAWLVLRGVRSPVAAGLALGIGGALAWDRAFSSGRPAVVLADPRVLALVVTVVLLITVAACVGPVRRAMAVDPAATLRRG